jgi:exodeoxyribonuclease V gamma subunit
MVFFQLTGRLNAMESRLSLFYSNRQEILFDRLKLSLFKASTSPFATRLVVVPTPAMKGWLLERLASPVGLGIACGVEVVLLEGAVSRLLELLPRDLWPQEAQHAVGRLQLALFIEAILTEILAADLAAPPWEPICRFLKGKPRRLGQLCDQLAGLFLHYGQYGGKMLAAWEAEAAPSCWQAALWRAMKARWPGIYFPYQLLDSLACQLQQLPPQMASQLQLHLFAMNFIPAQVHRFLNCLAPHLFVGYYQLSPCQLFWSDLCSDRQSVALQRYWQRQGASEGQQQALEELLRQCNGLLANFGRQGREMATLLEDAMDEGIEEYCVPAAVSSLPGYAIHLNDEVLFEGSSEAPLSLLQAVQADMTLLRTADEGLKIDISETLTTIQVHSAPSQFREVEILYNTLLQLITAHAYDEEPILPSDIVVMAPDLKPYAPLIDAYFGGESSKLHAQVVDSHAPARSSLIQGFFHLLNLAGGRWEAETLLALIEFPAFQLRHQLTAEEAEKIRDWTVECATSWGYSHDHRQELLQRSYNNRQPVDKSPAGTWIHTFGRLLMGLAVDPTGWAELPEQFDFPHEEIDASSAELLGRWIAIVAGLQRDLLPVAEEHSLSLSEWVTYLEELKNSYFTIDPKDDLSMECDAILTAHIRRLATVDLLLDKHPISYAAVRLHLDQLLDVKGLREAPAKGVRFGTLATLHCVPAKVIALIGMDEGAFPRVEQSGGLNELKLRSDGDYAPSKTDADRYLFLEVLLSARCYLSISYVSSGSDHGGERLPSLLVQELMNYIDSSYTIAGHLARAAYLHCHPFDGFDASYFCEGSCHRSFSHEQRQLADVHYCAEKNAAHRFMPALGTALIAHMPLPTRIDIADLLAVAANPIKAYFNRNLQIYIDEERGVLPPADEPFELNPLARYQMRTQGINSPFAEVVTKADKVGTLPPGLFKTVAVAALQGEVENIHQHLKIWQIAVSDISALHFSPQHKRPVQLPNGIWQLPPLTIQMGLNNSIEIVGWLREVTPQGLLIHQDISIEKLSKVWPAFLVMLSAVRLYDLPIAPQIISAKDGKSFAGNGDAAHSGLQGFLRYFAAASQELSPAIPEWVAALLKGDSAVFCAAMRTTLEDDFTPCYNSYLLWLFRGVEQWPAAAAWHDAWHPLVVEGFAGLQQLASRRG